MLYMSITIFKSDNFLEMEITSRKDFDNYIIKLSYHVSNFVGSLGILIVLLFYFYEYGYQNSILIELQKHILKN